MIFECYWYEYFDFQTHGGYCKWKDIEPKIELLTTSEHWLPLAIDLQHHWFLISKKTRQWTQAEHELFLTGLRDYGNKWHMLSTVVTAWTSTQIQKQVVKCLSSFWYVIPLLLVWAILLLCGLFQWFGDEKYHKTTGVGMSNWWLSEHVIAQWWRPVASIETLDLLYRVMHAVSYCRIPMAIKMVSKVGVLFDYCFFIVALAATGMIQNKLSPNGGYQGHLVWTWIFCIGQCHEHCFNVPA